MKRWTTAAMVLLLAFSLAACGGGREASQLEVASSSNTLTVDTPQEKSAGATFSSQAQEEASLPPEESIQQTDDEEGGGDRLVVYFTYGENAALPDGVDVSASASIQLGEDGQITGNTGMVASMIAEAAAADLFSIRTVQPYPDTYDATLDQAQEEQGENARPELAAQLENLDEYSVIFLGFPNWWGDMPMAVYRFLDEVDLSGKTIVPFVTSGGSGFSNTIAAITQLEPGAVIQEGLSIGGSGAVDAQDQVTQWLEELGYVQ
ncbi:MAG TPA: flavodoxin [Firmicutes bacterium]|nr:flavodoxin [Bacillota bacterium]